jgi:hypothetical protein
MNPCVGFSPTVLTISCDQIATIRAGVASSSTGGCASIKGHDPDIAYLVVVQPASSMLTRISEIGNARFIK